MAGRRIGARRAGLLVAIAALTGVAAVLRFHDLSSQPGGLFPDEAAEGNDAFRLSHDLRGFHPVFFDDDSGHEALFTYLAAAAFRIVGPSVTVLRGTAAFIGVLAVLAMPLALRRFGWMVSLTGMAWSATAVWLVAISRDGFRCILVALVGTLALAALLRWSDRPGRASALLAGVACGVGLWTYQPLKLLPVLVAAWLYWQARRDPGAWVRLRPGLPWLIGAWLVVAAPLIATAIIDPVGYFGRATSVSPFTNGDALPAHIGRTLGMFGLVGDPQPRHNVAGLPLLSLPLTVLAALGVARAWRARRDPGARLLLLGLPVFMIPPLLSTEGGSPHFLRSLGLAPYVAAMLGLGAVEAVALARHLARPQLARRTVAVVAATSAAALAAAGTQGAVAYFTRPVADRYVDYSFALVALAEAAGPATAVIIDGYDAETIRFIDRDHLPVIVDPGRPVPGGDAVVSEDHSRLLRIAGAAASGTVVPVAYDWQGRPVAWRLDP